MRCVESTRTFKRRSARSTSLSLVALLLVVSLGSACATILNGMEQSIEIDSQPPGAIALIRPLRIEVETPAVVSLPRASDYKVDFTLDGYAPQSVALERETSPAVWGNLVFLGFGMLVDGSTGAGFKLVPARVETVLVKLESGTQAETAGNGVASPSQAPLESGLTGTPGSRFESIPSAEDTTSATDATEAETTLVVLYNANGPTRAEAIHVQIDGGEATSIRRNQLWKARLRPGRHSLSLAAGDLSLAAGALSLAAGAPALAAGALAPATSSASVNRSSYEFVVPEASAVFVKLLTDESGALFEVEGEAPGQQIDAFVEIEAPAAAD